MLATELHEFGEDALSKEQKKATVALEDKIAAANFSGLDSTGVNSLLSSEKDTVITKRTAAQECGQNLGPTLISLTSLILSAVSNPSGAAISSLQLLTNHLKILPPGFGLPAINFQLRPGSGVDTGKKLLDLAVDIGGGFAVQSAMNAVNVLMEQAAYAVCDVMYPDIGPGAAKLNPDKPVIKEGFSSGIYGAYRTLGNQKIQNIFDKDGNPTQRVISYGIPSIVPRFDSRAEPAPPKEPHAEYPGYTGPNLKANDGTVPPVYRSSGRTGLVSTISTEADNLNFLEKLKLANTTAAAV